MKAKRIMVEQLFDRGFSTGEIFQQVKCLGINKLFMYRTINQLLETNSCKNTAWAGRRRSARIKERIKRIPPKCQYTPEHLLFLAQSEAHQLLGQKYIPKPSGIRDA